MAIPRARAHGLDLLIMGAGLRYHKSGEGAGIWVKKESPIKSVADLKGKKFGGLFARLGRHHAGAHRAARCLWLERFAQGWRLEFVEMPAPAMPAALATGKVDAATLIHAQAYKAMQTGEFRPIAQTAQDLTNKFHLRMVSAVIAGYGDKLRAKPDVYREFQRVLRASMEYAKAIPTRCFRPSARNSTSIRDSLRSGSRVSRTFRSCCRIRTSRPSTFCGKRPRNSTS